MSGAEGLPLKIIHYKVANYGGEGYDTGVRVTEEDLEEAKAAVGDTADAPDLLRPHLIADRLKEKFRDRIKATVEADPQVREYDPDNWRIQDSELGEAIRRVAGQKSKEQ